MLMVLRRGTWAWQVLQLLPLVSITALPVPRSLGCSNELHALLPLPAMPVHSPCLLICSTLTVMRTLRHYEGRDMMGEYNEDDARAT